MAEGGTATARRRVAVAVAPNGGRRTKADHRGLPTSAEELARTAAECLERGASMIHLHVRDPEGRHVLDAEAYRAAIGRIFQEVGDRLVIQITSESIGRYSPAEQREVVLRTNPEAASLALCEFAPDERAEKDFGVFLGRLKQLRIWPQFILYSPEEAKRFAAMQARGLIPFEAPAVLYVLGRRQLFGTAAPADLVPYVAPDMPRFPFWTVCAFGRREAACAVAAALIGGHARVGFENNLRLPSGEQAACNAELVGAVVNAVNCLGLAAQSADGLREQIDAAMG
jgi:3-keto-5-aminohexanoate cleavage enzyme